jgi:hypothetical protein
MTRAERVATSLREKLINIGAKVISHGRCDGRGSGAKADVQGNTVVDRPAAGAAGTGMTGRCGRRRRQRCALMKAKQRVPALRGGQPGDLASNRRSGDRFSLRRASTRRKITLNNPGIWGMSGNRRTHVDVVYQIHAGHRSRRPPLR